MDKGFTKTIDDLTRTIKQTMFTPTHKAGWPFILGFAIVSILLSLAWSGFAIIGLILTLWCVYFFRDPVRSVPVRENLVVSPGDGRVTQIVEACQLPLELRPDPTVSNEEDGDFTRISIFLSVFDVHVNRNPVSGLIKKLVYKPGIFLNAGNDLASAENERCAALIGLPDGRELGVVQIAGLVARRILCDLVEGQDVRKGERYGIIRFGSRMDVYLPAGTAPLVCVGQKMIGGETVLADLSSSETIRESVSI